MTASSINEMCDAIARRIAARKSAEIHKRVAELLEQEFAESGDAADEPKQEEAGNSSATETASASIAAAPLNVPAFLPAKVETSIPVPSKDGEATTASAQGVSSPALCAPADQAAVEGDCGHEPPASISIPREEASGTAREAPSAGSGDDALLASSGVQPAPPLLGNESVERDGHITHPSASILSYSPGPEPPGTASRELPPQVPDFLRRRRSVA
jgi:hypothetical protein